MRNRKEEKMINLNDTEKELYEKLKKLAWEKSDPFCYQCYQVCPTGRCPRCHSDDLMRHVEGVGVEYGIEWVVDHIIEAELEPYKGEEGFEQMIDECYGETVKVGWMDLFTTHVMKEMDPISYNMGMSEYIDNLRDDGVLVSFDNGSTFYSVEDVENLVKNVE
jgi:hypothetical protein